jgi:hypothetical protein
MTLVPPLNKKKNSIKKILKIGFSSFGIFVIAIAF